MCRHHNRDQIKLLVEMKHLIFWLVFHLLHLNKYKENSNLNKRSRTRTKNQSPLSLNSLNRAKSNSPFMKNNPQPLTNRNKSNLSQTYIHHQIFAFIRRTCFSL